MSRHEPDWQAHRHPESQYSVTPRGTVDSIPDGCGILRLRLEKIGRYRARRPAEGAIPFCPWPSTPVVLIDGVPTVQGYGHVDVVLPVGNHRVDVQAGGARGWWIAEISDQSVFELHSVNNIFGESESARDWTFAPPGPTTVNLAHHQAYVGALVYVVIPFGVFGAGVYVENNFGFEVANWSALAAVLFALVFFLANWLIYPTVNGWRVRRHTVRAVEQWTTRSQDNVQLLGPNSAGPPSPPPLGGGVVFTNRFEMVWQRMVMASERDAVDRSREYGEPVGPAATKGGRPWLANPVIEVDGNPVNVGWARCWLLLARGRHTITVRVPRRSEGPRLSSADHQDYIEVNESLDVLQGQVALVDTLAHVVQDFDGRDYELQVRDIDVEIRVLEPGEDIPPYQIERPPVRHEDGWEQPFHSFSVISN